VIALLVAAALGAAAPADMNGRWSVDLSASPDAPYFKPMNLLLREDGTATGDFYESEIIAGRWRRNGDRLCVAFRTTDGAGPYHTSACFVAGRIVGQTWAEHRDFLFLWTADRPRPE